MKGKGIIHIVILTGLAVLMASGCGYRYYVGPLKPADESKQIGNTKISDDGTITYIYQERLEISLRPMTDEELNRQFSAASKAEMKPTTYGTPTTNPYTFGDAKFWSLQSTPERFTVFRLKVKNFALPKIQIDPTTVVIVSSNKREYYALSSQQIDLYFRIYARAYAGNPYRHYQEAYDIAKRTMYAGDPLFSGQEAEGYVVFPVLHPDVKELNIWIKDIILRFDFRDEPAEKMDIRYTFMRDIGRIYPGGQIKLSKG